MEKAFRIASNFSEEEQEVLANHWIQEMKPPNFIEIIKDEMKWEKSLSKSQDVLEMLANKALEDARQEKAEEIKIIS